MRGGGGAWQKTEELTKNLWDLYRESMERLLLKLKKTLSLAFVGTLIKTKWGVTCKDLKQCRTGGEERRINFGDQGEVLRVLNGRRQEL